MSLLLLACLCGAAARGAPTAPRCLPESELEGYCRSRRLDGPAPGYKPTKKPSRQKSSPDVHDASTRGEVFIFFSHQWLGWSEPDPQRIHVKAMQQAVRAVSTDTDTPLEKIRVWVDYVSIPQKNLR